MAVGYNPRIVTDGLVLCLDAGNTKNYNSTISTNWTDNFGGNNGTLVGGTHHNDGPFVGAGYVEFDGTGDYLSIADSADFDFGTGDFTLEFWVYIKTSGQTDVLFVKRNSNAVYAPFMFILLNGDLQARYSTTGSSWSTTTIKTNANISTNTWHHVVMVRSGSSFTGFYDGQSVAMTSSSSSLTSNTDDLVIGGDKNTNYFDGYISNLRVLKGTALYTSDFTPPSSPLTAVTNTTLLCCQGGTNVDASPSAHTFQVIIGVPTLTSVGPSASKYFEFDGVDDYATLSSSQIAPGTGAFTWNFWAKHIPTAETGVGTKSVLFSGTGSNTTYGGVYMDSLTYGVFYYAQGYRIADYDTSFNDEWWHIAFVGNGGVSGSRTLKLYRNGVQAGSTYTYDYNFTSTTPYIGRNHSYAPESMRGFISNTTYYNRELTAAEVQQNYNALKGRYV